MSRLSQQTLGLRSERHYFRWMGGKTVIGRAAVAECRPDEWLLMEAWDAS